MAVLYSLGDSSEALPTQTPGQLGPNPRPLEDPQKDQTSQDLVSKSPNDSNIPCILQVPIIRVPSAT